MARHIQILWRWGVAIRAAVPTCGFVVDETDELLHLAGCPRLAVQAHSVQPVQLYDGDELLHHQGHLLVAVQQRP